MEFKKIKESKISEAVANQILNFINKGILKTGDKLPTEMELTKSLGVSRTAVREGMQRIDMLGLIEIYPGKGTFVKEVKKSDYNIFKDKKVVTSKKALLDIIAFRRIVETGIIELALDKMNDVDMKKLEKCILKYEKGTIQKDFLAERDPIFHKTLALSTHNTIISDFVNEFFYPLILNSMLNFEGFDHNKVISYHRAIFNALKHKDKNKSLKAMIDHLDWLVSIVEKSKK